MRPLRGARHTPLWMAGGACAALALLWGMTAAADAAEPSLPEWWAAREAQQRSDPDAVKLLGDAAGAARGTAYSGLEYTTAWHSGRAVTSRASVAHTPGDGTVLRAGGGAKGGVGDFAFEADSGGDASAAPVGVGGLSPKMLALLAVNYTVVRVADGRACGRAARVVEARRADGTPAGRFWLDRDTGVLLNRELLDPAGLPVLATGFQEFSVRPAAPPPGPLGQTATMALWGTELSPAGLGRLGGWRVPRTLPANLSLYEVRGTAPAPSGSADLAAVAGTGSDSGWTGDDGVVHLAYSDGLSAVSVFVQRGELDESRFGGWRRVTVQGRTVFEHDAEQRWAVWSSRGQVYTVLADAPRATTDAVIAALPHGPEQATAGSPWQRLRRGLGRVASWADPFR